MSRGILFFCLLAAFVISACGGSSASPDGVPLQTLAWCSAPTVAFEDDGVSPAAKVTSWPTARDALGFAPLLPPRLPQGTCLVAAGGVLHNAIFGGKFIITYALPRGGALSLAETPKQRDIPNPDCTTSPAGTSVPISTCQQTINGAAISLSSSQSLDQTRALLGKLRPNIIWLPGGKG